MEEAVADVCELISLFNIKLYIFLVVLIGF